MSAPARRVHFGHYLAYGSNDFLGAGAMSIIGFWILFFYTTFCGLSATQATKSATPAARSKKAVTASNAANTS